MSTMFYYKKNGGLSSIRTSMSIGRNRVDQTTYANSNRGGVTFRGTTITSRLNNSGCAMGSGTSIMNKSYFTGTSFSKNISRY